MVFRVGAVAGRQRLARRLGIGDEGQRRIGATAVMTTGSMSRRACLRGRRKMAARPRPAPGRGESKLVFCMTVRLCLCMSDCRARADAARGSWTGNAAQGGEGRRRVRWPEKRAARADRAIRPGRDRRGAAPAAGRPRAAAAATAARRRDRGHGGGGQGRQLGQRRRSRVWCATIQNGIPGRRHWPGRRIRRRATRHRGHAGHGRDGARVHQRRHHAGGPPAAEQKLICRRPWRSGGVRHAADRHQRAQHGRQGEQAQQEACVRSRGEA